jgi:HAE1 family hydrophobic/amphiphilic exporter-1
MVRDNARGGHHTEAGGGGGGTGGGGGGWGGGGRTHRGQIQIRLVPRAERTRTNDEIAQDLRRLLSGIPGVAVRAQASGGNFVLARLLGGGGNFSGGGDSRLALEIRGYDLDDARRVAQESITMMQGTPGIADVRLGRDEGRPEISVRVDRPKAAMLGLTVSGVATTIQTNVAGTTAAQFRERGNEYPVVVRLREPDREQVSDVGDVPLSTPSGQVVPAKNVSAEPRRRPGADRSKGHGAHHRAGRAGNVAQRGRQRRAGAHQPGPRAP